MCVLEMITMERPYIECQNAGQIFKKVVNGVPPRSLDRVKDDDIFKFI